MRRKLLSIIVNPGSNKLLLNFFSLAMLQATNSILPLLVFPLLIRVIGVEKFGAVSLALSMSTYLIIFTDYGFNLSATRSISIHRNNLAKVSQIFSEVLITKLILFLVSIGLVTIVVFLVPRFRAEWLLYMCTLSIVFGNTIFPVWFFQGMEYMRHITFINLISKIVFTGLIFIFIQSPHDYIYVPAYQGVGGIVASVASFWIIRKQFGVHLRLVKVKNITYQLREGWPVFLSNFSSNFYINSNIFILSFFANATVIGYYSIAEKIIWGVRQLLTAVFQSIYPHVCKIATESHEQLKNFFYGVSWGLLGGCFLIGISILIFANPVVYIVSGKYIGEVVFLVRLLAFVPLISALNIPAFQTLLAYNLQRSSMIILFIGCFVSLFSNSILANLYLATGTIISVMITELFITVGLYVVLYVKHPMFAITPFSKR